MIALDSAIDGALACVLPLLAWRVVVSDDLPKAVVLFISVGLLSALSWARLGAPDVGLVEAAVGAGLTGALLMSAIGWVGPERRPRTMRPLPLRILLSMLLAGVALVLASAIWHLPDQSPGLSERVLEEIGSSEISHPVTAVLLDFRAYDTLLEVGVLLVAAIATRSQLERRPGTYDGPAEPLVAVLARALFPGIVLVAGYLWWRGARAPGGAFQAGAILGGGGILLVLAKAIAPFSMRSPVVRLALAGGLLFFSCVAAAPLLSGDEFLEYPRARAKALILSIELVLTLSIAMTFTVFFPATRHAGRPGSRVTPGEVE